MTRSVALAGMILLFAAAWIGCAGGISRHARSQVTFFQPFSILQQHPDKYHGATVIWGGRILSSAALKGATELEVLQLNLNTSKRPVNNDQSQGRFLIRSDRFIDPALYPKGALITVVGPLTGSQDRPIGRMTYTYPVIGVTEIKKWPPGSQASPRIHFGIGIGTHF